MSDTRLAAQDYLAVLRRDAARMLDLADGPVDARVPACPGWTLLDVLTHTGSVYAHKVASLRLPAGAAAGPRWHDLAPADGESARDWFAARVDELIAALEAADADGGCFTWHPEDRTVAFWLRRMAQETAVHRVDVESSIDAVSPVDDALAVDGIDEVLDRFLVHWHAEGVGPDAPGRGTVVVRTGAHVWRAKMHPDAVELSREPGPGDAVVSGEPSELLLWLWGRRPDTAVTVEGDGELVAALRERLRRVTE